MHCGCLLVSLISPRIGIVLLILFSDWLSRAYGGLLIPLLGLIFMPYSVLWYSVVVNHYRGEWGFWQIAFMVLAVLLDLSSGGGGATAGRWRRRD